MSRFILGLVLGVLVTPAGCATLSDPAPPPAGSPEVREAMATLLVENESSRTLEIVTDASPIRVGIVSPDGSACLVLRVRGVQQLTARPTGGGREPAVSPRFDPATSPGWRWEVGASDVRDATSLAPTAACDPG